MVSTCCRCQRYRCRWQCWRGVEILASFEWYVWWDFHSFRGLSQHQSHSRSNVMMVPMCPDCYSPCKQMNERKIYMKLPGTKPHYSSHAHINSHAHTKFIFIIQYVIKKKRHPKSWGIQMRDERMSCAVNSPTFSCYFTSFLLQWYVMIIKNVLSSHLVWMADKWLRDLMLYVLSCV